MPTIRSESNAFFRRCCDLHTSRGIRKWGEALVHGLRIGTEVVRDFPGVGVDWLLAEGMAVPSGNRHLPGQTFVVPLFDRLDLFGTREPILRVQVPELGVVTAVSRPTAGISLVLPFQNPENIGATLRSAAAFGVRTIVLTEEAAHPFHPRSMRAAAGSVLRLKLVRAGPLASLSLPWEVTVALDLHGESLRGFPWPPAGVLVPGLEGPGLPSQVAVKARRVTIPMAGGVESLNGMVATSIALYEWCTSRAVSLKFRPGRSAP